MHTLTLTINCELLTHVPSQFSIKAHFLVNCQEFLFIFVSFCLCKLSFFSLSSLYYVILHLKSLNVGMFIFFFLMRSAFEFYIIFIEL